MPKNWHDGLSRFTCAGQPEERLCSKIFDNRDFGYLKITVERPLRLNFKASPERIARLDSQSAFAALAASKKRKNAAAAQAETTQGQALQQQIKATLAAMDGDTLYTNRDAFIKALDSACKKSGLKLATPLKKAVLAALSERDPEAGICTDSKGRTEADSELRDSETVPLPAGIPLPLPLGYDNESGHEALLALVKDHCEDYLAREVLPHVPDAWIDHGKTRIGYEIPLTRHFYTYRPPRPLADIAAEIAALEQEIAAMLKEAVQ